MRKPEQRLVRDRMQTHARPPSHPRARSHVDRFEVRCTRGLTAVLVHRRPAHCFYPNFPLVSQTANCNGDNNDDDSVANHFTVVILRLRTKIIRPVYTNRLRRTVYLPATRKNLPRHSDNGGSSSPEPGEQRGAAPSRQKKDTAPVESPVSRRARARALFLSFSIARARKGTSPLSLARVLMNLFAATLRSHPLLVRASPMDCQPPRQKLRRNTPTHLPPLQPLRGRPRFAATAPTPTDVFHSFSARGSVPLATP